jgi:histidinol-phosphate aminotransferase
MQDLINPGIEDLKPYIPGKRADEVQKELGLNKIVKMSSNESMYGLSEKVQEAFRQSAEDLHLYPASGDAELCAALAKLHGIDPGAVVMGNGSDAVIYNLGMTIVNEGDEIIIPEITFSIYRTIVKAMRGTVVASAMKDLRIDTKDILSRISPKTKAVFLCSPNNPTGDALPPAEIHDFLRQVPEKILIALDEAYVDFMDEDLNPGSIELFKAGQKNLFILRSLSKSYAIAGLRLGYGIGDPELISYMKRVRQPFDVSLPAQRAGIAALGDRGFFEKNIAAARREMDYFRRRMREEGIAYVDSQTNFFLIDTGLDSHKAFEELQKKGVIVRPGGNFGAPDHIRVTVGTREQNEYFFRALLEVMRG